MHIVVNQNFTPNPVGNTWYLIVDGEEGEYEMDSVPPIISIDGRSLILLDKQAAVSHLSPTQKAGVVSIITMTTTTFQQQWQARKSALGTTQYASGQDGLTAMSDPNSAASKFAAFKQANSPTSQETVITDAFKQADALYGGSTDDTALATWRDDTSQLLADISIWEKDATEWQIQTISQQTFQSTTDTVTSDFTTIQQDIQAIS